MILTAEKVTKSYSDKILLNEVSFYVNEGNKIGIIGINGAGKTTLLRILAQSEVPDSGTLTRQAGVRIGYLPQSPVLAADQTVLEQVLLGATAEQRELQEYEAKTILTKLGITAFDQKISELSGGQRKRVAMAGVLSTPCEALILDEPTNHLDNDMIAWLETYLMRYTGAIVMVTHDRYFLDRVVSKIVEIDKGNLYTYDANYSKYVELKALREEMEQGTERKRRSILRTELEWIRRGPRARGTKSKSRIERFEELSEKTGAGATQKLSLSSVSSRLGKKTIELEGISKGFGQRVCIKHFDHVVARDARIGIVGENGCGKSTLLNIISGRLAPDTGSVIRGDTVRVGYFAQECEHMDASLRVIDYIKGFAEYIVTTDGRLSASQMLEKFLFPPDLQWNTIGRLSGGERRRLFLLSILMQAPNVLLLDEPTNDLDIDTLVVLEEYLENFDGIVLTVSHDRYFLDKVVDVIFEFQAGGTIKQYLGAYSAYMTARTADATGQEPEAPKQASVKKRSDGDNQKVRFSFKEQREYEAIDDEIAQLEQKQRTLEEEMQKQASNYEKLEQLMAQKEMLDQGLAEKTERWFYLQALAEKIAEQGAN